MEVPAGNDPLLALTRAAASARTIARREGWDIACQAIQPATPWTHMPASVSSLQARMTRGSAAGAGKGGWGGAAGGGGKGGGRLWRVYFHRVDRMRTWPGEPDTVMVREKHWRLHKALLHEVLLRMTGAYLLLLLRVRSLAKGRLGSLLSP